MLLQDTVAPLRSICAASLTTSVHIACNIVIAIATGPGVGFSYDTITKHKNALLLKNQLQLHHSKTSITLLEIVYYNATCSVNCNRL